MWKQNNLRLIAERQILSFEQFATLKTGIYMQQVKRFIPWPLETKGEGRGRKGEKEKKRRALAATYDDSVYDWTLADKTMKCKIHKKWTERIVLETWKSWASKDRDTNYTTDQSSLKISQKSYAQMFKGIENSLSLILK